MEHGSLRGTAIICIVLDSSTKLCRIRLIHSVANQGVKEEERSCAQWRCGPRILKETESLYDFPLRPCIRANELHAFKGSVSGFGHRFVPIQAEDCAEEELTGCSLQRDG